MNPQEASAAFLGAVEASPVKWKSVDIRVVVVKLPDGWHNLYTRAYMDLRSPEDIPRFEDLPSTELLKGIQLVLPATGLKGLILGIESGAVEWESDTVFFRGKERGAEEWGPYRDGWVSFQELGEARAQPNHWSASPFPEWSSENLQLYGSPINDFFTWADISKDDLDMELRTLVKPYDGLESLLMLFLGAPEGNALRDRVSFSAFAPYKVHLKPEGCHLSEEHLAVQLVCANEIRDHLSVGLVAWGRTETGHSETLDFQRGLWTVDGPWATYQGFHDVGGNPAGTVLTRIGPRCTERLNVGAHLPGSHGARAKCYVLFDPDYRQLQKSLRVGENKKRAPGFELAVVRLFHLLGFSVNPLVGDQYLSEAVDFLAFGQHPNMLLAVECTIGSIDSGGKLGKLSARNQQIRQRLSGLQVQPVVATALDRSSLSPAELRSAARDRISVLTSEDLETLLAMVASGASNRAAWDYVHSQVPELDLHGW